MNLPEVNVSPEKLYQMLFESIRSKILIAAIELKIFNYLSEPKSADQVAKDLNSHPQNTMLLLNGMTTCELLVKKRGLYQNAPIAQTFLIQGKPTYLGEGLIAQANMSISMLDDLSKLVKEGLSDSSYEKNDDSGRDWGKFATWMANHERAGIAQQMTNIVSNLSEFNSFQKMLDLGGGPGIFCIAMVQKHPFMKGVIFDRQPVVAVSKKFINEYELENRIETIAGDYNIDPIGQGYDFIWASATLNFAIKNIDALMTKIYNALNPKGVFINLSEGLTHERTKPDFFVLNTLGWSMTQSILAFEQGFIADAIINAGFKSVQSRTLQTGWGPMDIDIARK